MANDSVTIAGRDLRLAPGDSAERMEHVAEYARRVLADLDARNAARGCEHDAQGRALELALRLADELFMAQDENSRLRRELLPLRRRCYELEQANDAQNRELVRLRERVEAQPGANGAASTAGDASQSAGVDAAGGAYAQADAETDGDASAAGTAHT